MKEQNLAAQIKLNILCKLDDHDLPQFIQDEVLKISNMINYYKLSNINSNLEQFCEFLDDMNEYFIQDVFGKLENKYGKVDIEIENTEIFNDILEDQMIGEMIGQYLNENQKSKLLQYLSVGELENIYDLVDPIKDVVNILETCRVKVVTLLTLKISEFINNPTRATQKLKHYFIKEYENTEK